MRRSREMILPFLVILGSALLPSLAQSAPPESISLMQTLTPWMYPGSEMPHGARMSDGGNPQIQSIQCQAVLTTPDPIDKVIAFYTRLTELKEGKDADAKSVSTRDDSKGRPVTLRVIVVNRADTTTTLVISRAADEKLTHIVWLHYIQLAVKPVAAVP